MSKTSRLGASVWVVSLGGAVAMATDGCDRMPPARTAVGPVDAPSGLLSAAPPEEARPTPAVDHHVEAAIAHLDARVADWMEHTPSVGNNVACAMTCHTAMPAALVHGAAKSASPVMARLRERVEARLDQAPKWGDATPFYGAKGSAKDRESLASEAVLNANALVAIDRSNDGAASEATLRAFDAMWSTMRPEGSFDWLDFGLEPFEHGESAIGAAFAARAVGALPGGAERYAPEVARLRSHLASIVDQPGTPLFDAALGVWSLRALGGVDTAERARFRDAVIATQHAEGAWSWTAVGVAGARAGLDTGDALPTAVVLLGLCDAADARSIDVRRRGFAWLVDRQSEDGTFPSRSPNHDQALGDLLLSDAATAFSALALLECAP